MPHVAKAFENSATGLTPITLYSLTELRVDKATGRLLISSTNGVGPNTEYSEGTTAASAIGIAFLVKDSNNILRVAKSDTAGVLRVQQGDLSRAVDDVSSFLASDTSLTNFASVTNVAPTTQYGLVTRNIPSGVQPIGGADGSAAPSNSDHSPIFSVQGYSGNLQSAAGNPVTMGIVDTANRNIYLKGTDNGYAYVQNATSSTVVNAGTFSVQATSATCVGDVASGSTNVSNPLQMGGRSATQLPTAVGDAQRVAKMFDKYGRQPTLPFGLREQVTPITKLTLSSTNETTLISAAGGILNDILNVCIVNTSTTAASVDLRDSTAGTVRATFYAPVTDMRGIVYSFPKPQASSSNNWTVASSVASNLIITGDYISNK